MTSIEPIPAATWVRPAWASEDCVDDASVTFERPASTVVVTVDSDGTDDDVREINVALSRHDIIRVDATGPSVTVSVGRERIYVSEVEDLTIEAARQMRDALTELLDVYDGVSG